jgi:hypothetical protein
VADAGDNEHAVGRDHLQRGSFDAGQLDDDVQRRRVVTAEAVDVRPEAVARADVPGDVPEVAHELADLVVQPVDVVSLSHLWW